MARITYTDNLFDMENLTSFGTDSLALTSVKSRAITFTDDNGARIVLQGEDFERKKGKITDGDVTSATFYNADGDKIYTFADIDASAREIHAAFRLDSRANRIMHGLMQDGDTVTGSKHADSLWGFAGADKLHGGAGNDYIYGHAGNDILTGGKGEDRFTFLSGTGHDTVTDFDIDGGKHDFIYMDYYLYDDLEIRRAVDDVVLEMPGGEQLTIRDISKAQLTVDFFEFF